MPFALDRTKVYRFTARWGEARDTDDRDGTVVETSPARPAPDALAAALPRFVGRIEQVPPAFSAVKVEGQIGRASCRERVCQYVCISVVAVSLKKKNETTI